MFSLILFEPEIPPNTGNIMRLCANTGARLHLVEPLGFELDDKKLRRAGLDYREFADVAVHADLDACLAAISPAGLYALSTRGNRSCFEADFTPDDAFLFGPETRGLPQSLLDSLSAENVLRLPMISGSRSLNLANAAAVVLYEAWRQQGFVRGS